MNEPSRVLGYSSARALDKEDLKKIAGGSSNNGAKATVSVTGQISGSHPGNMDGEFDQILD